MLQTPATEIRAPWDNRIAYYMDCQTCGRTNVSHKARVCPSCNGPASKKMVMDTHKAARPRHQCGPKCTSATGPNCDCQCGGRNHGAGC